MRMVCYQNQSDCLPINFPSLLVRFQQEESDIGFPGGNGPIKALTYYVYGSCPNC